MFLFLIGVLDNDLALQGAERMWVCTLPMVASMD